MIYNLPTQSFAITSTTDSYRNNCQETDPCQFYLSCFLYNFSHGLRLASFLPFRFCKYYLTEFLVTQIRFSFTTDWKLPVDKHE